ncbi:hypothetical protein N181_09760 [Sinorhizobium fredii USDA 205]|nr:hypothetical protein N181_09760 [Sinorhizobium fredii USDA 205]
MSNQVYLTTSQVLQRYSISEMSLWRWQKNESLGFPRPMIVNKRKFFKEEDLVAWERERARASA